MTELERSGLYYPNKFALLLLRAIEAAVGEREMPNLLTRADLERLIGNYPPDNWEREFDFADITALRIALDQKYGTRGGAALTLRAGREMFPDILKSLGALFGEMDGFFVTPIAARLPLTISALATLFRNFSDQVSTVSEQSDCYVFTLECCPFCYKQRMDNALCQVSKGLLLEWLRFFCRLRSPAGWKRYTFRIEIASCQAQGADMGRLIIYKEPPSDSTS
jgi:hypothetical protein